MALIKDAAGRETAAPTPRKFKPLPQQGRGPVVRPATRPEPQQTFRRAAAPAPSFEPRAVQASLLPKQWQEPVAVQVVPEQQPVVVELLPQQQPMTALTMPQQRAVNANPASVVASDSEWINSPTTRHLKPVTASSPGVPDELRARLVARDTTADYYNTRAKMGERDRLRQEREAADRDEKPKALTEAEWNAYSPLQQAAVQANADLATAIRRDFKMVGKHHATADQIKSYQDRTEDLFGEEGQLGFKGLEYAPNTVAFLDARGIERADLAGKTLDDLISGDALMTKKVIDRLGEVAAPTAGDQLKKGAGSARDANIAFASNLAKGQLKFQEQLASKLKAGDKLLTDMTSHAGAKAADETYGAKEMAPMTRLTDVRPETLGQIDKYMEALARPDLDPSESMSMIELDLAQRGAKPDEIKQVYQSMQDRVRLGMQGDGNWFPNVDYKLRSPSEVASLLGVPTLKRAGA